MLLQTTANNIANQDTPNFKAERTDLVDLSGGGVAGKRDLAKCRWGINRVTIADPAREMVNLAQEKLMYTANAMVIDVANRMVGSLLDIFDSRQR